MSIFEYDEDMVRAFNNLERRWDELFAWSAKTGHALPPVEVAAWRSFSENWKGWFLKDWGSPIHPHDASALRAATHDLAAAEGAAQLQGYSSADVPALTPEQRALKGAPSSPIPVKAPTFEQEHPIATKIDDNAPRLPPKPEPDPNLGIKLGVVGALAVGTLISAATSRSDTARAGFAVGGSALTLAAAGALLFGGTPSTPGKKGA
jgi:hypothetical protein